jgi:O-antigen chain-terminating methyltransferase
MTPDDRALLDGFDRQRRDADQRYNDALTAFDAALIRTTPPATDGLVADPTPPSVPAGWRGWRLHAVQRWLTPWMERQHTFNARTADAVETLISREHEGARAFEQFQSALIIFLQQITAFVETKDRQLTANAARRFDEQQRILNEQHRILDKQQRFLDEQQPFLALLPEWRAQLAVLQRATEVLKRRITEAIPDQTSTAVAGTSDRGPAVTRIDSTNDYKYVAFEDAFRGSEESVTATLDEYLPIFAGATDVVDLGCGRGEFLAALRSAGVHARGVDTNDAMVAVAREQGLDVTRGDALGYVAALPDESIGGAIATQVVEHLEPTYLMQLLDSLSRTLRPGAPIVLETINPACWYAFFSSYIRDITHVRPVHPETLQYLLRASGFERVEIRYRSPLPDHVKLKTIDLADEVLASIDGSELTLPSLAQALNENAGVLNRLLFTYMDYAVVGYRS